MFKLTLTLLFSLSITATIEKKETEVLQGMFNQLQKDVFEPKKCSTLILGLYLENEGPSMSSTAGENVHDLCPSIKQSCCNFEQLVEVHEDARQSYLKSLEFSKMLQRLTNKVADLSESEFQKINQRFEENQDCKYDNEKGQTFETAFNYLKEKKSFINNNFEKGIEYYSRKSAGFACALCDQRSHGSIKTKGKKDNTIQIDLKQCKSFYSSPEISHYVTSIIHIPLIYHFYQSLLCLEGHKRHKADLSNISDPSLLDKTIELYMECGKGTNMQTMKGCLEVCKLDDLFNINYFARYFEDILTMDLMADHLIKESDFDMNENQTIYEEKVKEIGVYFFVNPLKTKSRIDKLPKEYSFGTGWNILSHEFITNKAIIKENSQGIKSIFVKGGIDKIAILIMSSILFIWYK